MRNIAIEGIDLNCGAVHDGNSLTIELSESEIGALKRNNIFYNVEIDDLSKFYAERAKKDLPKAIAEIELDKARKSSQTNNQFQKSESSVTLENILQYEGCDEINWVTPTNFPNLTSLTMGGCLTVSQMEQELDDMYTYSQTNSLDIVSAKSDASPTGQKTWGNPATTITNPQDNGPATYTGIGTGATARWDPKTIYYLRLTGNQSSTAEGTKPQILFTSMIHSRELSALMNNIYFMWYLIENYNTNDAIKELVDNNELYFVPVVNPDGLRWNEHLNPGGGGMQRKNCRPNTGSTSNTTEVRGVDLNRNFDYYWGYNNIGSSGTASSGTYRGPSPSSEPETQIMVDFITKPGRNFKTGVWNHSYANSVPHPYGGVPTLQSGREDEFHRWHEEMTRYNRYLYGATIFYESNGLPDDWMLGGAPDNNTHTGSGQAILATTPEHGSSSFWPSTAQIVPIAKQSMRISLATAYYGGKYAKLHDLTQSNLSGATADLDFGIERVGQTGSDYTVTVTAISSNITGVTQAGTETGMSALEQRTVTAQLQLAGGIVANEKIEYNVQLANDSGIIYDADYVKYYQPTLLFNHIPDTNGLTGWTQSGGWNNTAVDAYSGSNALRTGDAVPYANNNTKTLTTSSSYDFSSYSEVLIQFYAKWDLERNYDFVEIISSTNGGTSWSPLCGKYTKPNATSTTTNHDNKSSDSNFQANSEGQIYDGDKMDNWVMEEITIDASNNSFLLGASNVLIQFNFRSDASDVSENYTTTSDGFFVDDFKIIGLQIPCETTVPASLGSASISASEATISWDNIPSATYDLRYKEVTSSTWIDISDLSTSSTTLTGLLASTNYEVQVRSKCDASNSSYTSSHTFTTTAINYCVSVGTTQWQTAVTLVNFNTLNNADNEDPKDKGYEDFTGLSTDVTRNSSYTLTVNVNTDGAYTIHAFAWIDWNQDGTFNTADEQFDLGDANNVADGVTNISPSILIPLSANLGTTRMRVVAKYNANPTACEASFDGEVEDYTINITPPPNETIANGYWNNDETWLYDKPLATHNVIINNLITIDANANATINDLTIGTGSLTINSGGSLIVDGTSSGDITYNVGITDINWHLVSSPVVGEQYGDTWNTANGINQTGQTNTLAAVSTYSNTTDVNGDWNYFAIGDPDATFNTAQGYSMKRLSSGDYAFTGTLQTSDFTTAITANDVGGVNENRWTLIGNCFPSYISVTSLLSLAANTTALEDNREALYVWNGSVVPPAYEAITTGYIHPGQAFFVNSNVASTSIAINEDMLSHQTGVTFYRSSFNDPSITLMMTDGNVIKSTEINYLADKTTGLDPRFDIGTFTGQSTAFSVYSHLVNTSEGIDFMRQALPQDYENLIVPVGINAASGTEITISASSVNLPAGINIYLEDKDTNTFIVLNAASDFTTTPTSDLSGIGRFYLHTTSSALSINDNSLAYNLQIYTTTNPKELIVKGKLSGATEAEFYDIQGRLILSNKLDRYSTKNTIDISSISTGIYLVKVDNGNQTKTQKVIIK